MSPIGAYRLQCVAADNSVCCRFATVDVMRHYGYLLETFRSNPEHLNDALFTMMHHISGDLNQPEALYIPHILKAFSDIWEQASSLRTQYSTVQYRQGWGEHPQKSGRFPIQFHTKMGSVQFQIQFPENICSILLRPPRNWHVSSQ